MQATFLTIWILLIFSCIATVHGTGSRSRHGGCNFRIVRDIMRRACAYHSSENSLMSKDLDTDELLSRSLDGDYHETGRIKKEIELLYIRRILKECCPNGGCPPLSKFCQ